MYGSGSCDQLRSHTRRKHTRELSAILHNGVLRPLRYTRCTVVRKILNDIETVPSEYWHSAFPFHRVRPHRLIAPAHREWWASIRNSIINAMKTTDLWLNIPQKRSA
jgi:hypothetical protein